MDIYSFFSAYVSQENRKHPEYLKETGTLFLSERQKMVVLLPYNQITAAGFSLPFYNTSIKRDQFLYTLPLIYITSVKT